MASGSDIDLEAIVERCKALSADSLVESSSAYVETASESYSRFVSGADDLDPAVLSIAGARNAIVSGFGASFRKWRQVEIVGDGNVVYAAPHSRISGLSLSITGRDNIVYLGAFSSAGQVTIAIHGNNLTTAIGDRCMFSNAVVLGRTSPIGIYARETGQRFDRPGDIRIGAHCWIGRNVTIEHGVTIGSETIVAQCAYVNQGVYP